MKELIFTIAGGMGFLIFGYLLFTHGDSAIGLTNALGTQVIGGTKVLQGR